ncbi:hypothetical protein DQG13_03120 [Paenibacillus sp. YN15]|nr:hypothetical protein DQG13_03120 [Paenibacillus sp. YN15]
MGKGESISGFSIHSGSVAVRKIPSIYGTPLAASHCSNPASSFSSGGTSKGCKAQPNSFSRFCAPSN